MEVKEVSDADLEFGVYGPRRAELLPAMSEIPDSFKGYDCGGWNKLIEAWFFDGLAELSLIPKEGISTEKALRHVSAIMKSFDPAHEHKVAGCAYLLSQWFERGTWKTGRGKRGSVKRTSGRRNKAADK